MLRKYSIPPTTVVPRKCDKQDFKTGGGGGVRIVKDHTNWQEKPELLGVTVSPDRRILADQRDVKFSLFLFTRVRDVSLPRSSPHRRLMISTKMFPK